jgi:hypothetical protein
MKWPWKRGNELKPSGRKWTRIHDDDPVGEIAGPRERCTKDTTQLFIVQDTEPAGRWSIQKNKSQKNVDARSPIPNLSFDYPFLSTNPA